ncbi:hypothetical protein HRR99_20600 [Agrobacterium vaccinii]|uniref:hypothetical protein n=1 Tax=Agrobacterium vaccinii TaxID=2735528 RepID=UPI001E653DB3|nr:hypothetical protein [Agrobacterium vaccinii]UHS63918.1 hypothetical protein HRR99_20600 [Agrobacterium vaccinii]
MDRPAVPYDLRWRFAVHEAGHAIIHHILKLGPIHGINIDTANGGYSQLGFTASGSDTLGYLEDMLTMLMAGLPPSRSSSGSGGSDDSDLAGATKLALALERTPVLLHFNRRCIIMTATRHPFSTGIRILRRGSMQGWRRRSPKRKKSCSRTKAALMR